MRVRVTRCMSWGEEKKRYSISMASARVCFVEYVTLCGRDEENPIFANGDSGKRPKGTCPRCWKSYSQFLRELQLSPNENIEL